MTNISIKSLNIDRINNIQPLWEKLNLLHVELNTNFKEKYEAKTWTDRKNELLGKAEKMLIEIAIIEGSIVGYCITTIKKENTEIGELDSLFIEDKYRKHGIGEQLTQNAIDWMNKQKATTQQIMVASGNEKVLSFYGKFGFKPLHLILQKK